MEAFNILKFWRNAVTDTSSGSDDVSDLDSVKKYVVDGMDYVQAPAPVTDEETDDDDESFFDLVFTGPNGAHKLDNNNAYSVPVKGCSVKNFPESPKDVFYKPKGFQIESNSKPMSPITMLKSAPKFRVFLLGFRKSKTEKIGVDDSVTSSPKNQNVKVSPNEQSKRFTVKCEEVVPVNSVFTRDNSLRSKLQKEKEDEFVRSDVPKYLKLMKPLYARASKRYTEKIKVSDISTVTPLSSPSIQSLNSPRKPSDERSGNRVAALGAVRKHLGKRRSAVSGAGVSSPAINRRDDSLLEQNDGIQNAILYCKRSYSSTSKDCLVCGNEDMTRASSSDQNRWSI